MWGPGAIIHIINILPFAAPFLWTLNFRRYNLLGINPIGMRRQYYRKWWVRLFFGRFNYSVLSAAAFLYIMHTYINNTKNKKALYSFTSYLNDVEQYDEQEHPIAHKALVHNLYHKRFGLVRDAVLRHRAERDHDLKVQAFNEFSLKYDADHN